MTFSLRRSSFLAVAAAFAGLITLCASGENVQAQANAPPAVAPAPRLTLTAEQEYIIREIILKDSNVQRENSAPETIGDVVPDDIKLYPLPPEVAQKFRRLDPTCSSSKMMRSSSSVRVIGESPM
jgi:hypothetical protein